MKIKDVDLLDYKQAQDQEKKPLSTDDECLICLEKFTSDSGLIAKVKACGTHYHEKCLRKVSTSVKRLSQNPLDPPAFVEVIKCPDCRVELPVGEVRETVY